MIALAKKVLANFFTHTVLQWNPLSGYPSTADTCNNITGEYLDVISLDFNTL